MYLHTIRGLLAASALSLVFLPRVQAATTDQPSNSNTEESGTLQEVIVTSRKREENLQDVPVAISVVSSDTLLQSNALSLQDYYATVPGLSLNDQGTGGRVNISIRGLSSTVNPTVGITVDDVPIGATDTDTINLPNYVPEFDPADLQRVEVLKGPQGTLYGAGSVGGVLRYVTAVPDFTAFSGRVETDGVWMPDGGTGWGVRAGVNVPLCDSLAIRISAFDRHDPGFIDDPVHGQSNINQNKVYGGRIDTLWKPTDSLSVRLAAFIQHTEGYDPTTDVYAPVGRANVAYAPIYGNLTNNRVPGAGGYVNENQVYSATLKYTSSYFDVTSITSFNAFHDTEDYDATGLLGAAATPLYGVEGAKLWYPIETNKFSQELRFSSPASSTLDWLLGAFYTREFTGTNYGDFQGADSQTGAIAGPLLTAKLQSDYTERAVFGDLTYHFTDRFDVQVGGRASHNWQWGSEYEAGPVQGTPIYALVRSADSSYTYLFSPKLKLSNAVTTYARVASGYQSGGPNLIYGPSAGLPLTFSPSKNYAYELGIKSTPIEGHLTINGDLFYNSWNHIQLLGVTSTGFAYVFNGGTARSDGLEAEVEFRPVQAFSLTGSVAYTDAVLTATPGEGFPGKSGDPIPFVSKFTTSLSGEERFPLFAASSGFVSAEVAYVGKRYTSYTFVTGVVPQPGLPGYTTANVQAGVMTGDWKVNLFVKNLTNEKGLLSASYGFGPPGAWQVAIVTPRTVGLSVTKTFH